MLISFRLSMPNVGSWNGQWTGSERNHVKYRKVSRKKAESILEEESFFYSFGDGWNASISIKKIDAKEAAKIRKHSDGFSGYDWMIDSILCHGEILNTKEIKDKLTKETVR